MSVRVMRRGLLVLLLALLAGCSSVMGPGVAVTTTDGQMVPLVSNTGDPEDDIGPVAHEQATGQGEEP